MPKLIPLPTMIDPRNAVFELSSLTPSGQREASAKEKSAARIKGGSRIRMLRHQR